MQLLKNADLDPAKNFDVKKNSVSDPYSSNPDPDPAKNLNPDSDPDPGRP